METELEVDDLGGASDADHGLDVTSAWAIDETGGLDDSSTASESSETSLEETSGADDDLGDAIDGASVLAMKGEPILDDISDSPLLEMVEEPTAEIERERSLAHAGAPLSTDDALAVDMSKPRPQVIEGLKPAELVPPPVHAGMPVAQAYESWEDHLANGGCGGLKSCARCIWMHFGHKWQVELAFDVAGEKKTPIVERPRSWGGSWAIGCCVCARAGVRGKYSNFTVSSTSALQLCNLRAHCEGPKHQDALREFQEPQCKVKGGHGIAESGTATPDLVVDDLSEDWGEDVEGAPSGATFAHALTTFFASVSFRATEKLVALPQLIADDAEIEIDGERRKVAAVLKCCAESAQVENREHLRTSDDVSIQADGRHAEHLVTGVATARATLKSVYFVIGAKLRVTGGIEGIIEATQQLCDRFSTPLGGELDPQVHGKLVGQSSIVRSYEADGASDERGAGLELTNRGVFPNKKISCREKGHAASSVTDTYKHIPVIKDHTDKWLYSKNSILRVIHNSEVLQNMYVAEQEQLLARVPRAERPPVIKDFSYAKQRFNSSWEPFVKHALTPDETAGTVAKGADHFAGKAKGVMLRDHLVYMTGSVEAYGHAGHAADAGSAGESFVRFYDTPWWEKSKISSVVDTYRRRLHQLFAVGIVLDPVLGAATYTQKLVRFLHDNRVYRCGGRAYTMPRITDARTQLKPVLLQWQAWRLFQEEALDAEFPDFELLQTFIIFSLDASQDAQTLKEKVIAFARGFGFEGEEAFLRQWAEVRAQAIVLHEQNPRMESWRVWKDALDYFQKGMGHSRTHRRHPTQLMRRARSLDQTITGSSCGVERLFGAGTLKLTPQRAGHMSEETRTTCYILIVSAPRDVKDMIRKDTMADGRVVIRCSRFIRRAQQIWLATQPKYRGAQNYRQRIQIADKLLATTPAHKAGTIAAAKAEWHGNIDALAKASIDIAEPGPDDEARQILQGLPGAQKAMSKYATKYCTKMVEARADGCLPDARKQAAEEIVKVFPKIAAKVSKERCPSGGARVGKVAGAAPREPSNGTATSTASASLTSTSQEQAGASATASGRKMKVFFSSGCKTISKELRGDTVVVTKTVTAADIIAVSDISCCPNFYKFIAVVRGLRLCTPDWILHPASAPSVKYDRAPDGKLGIYLSAGFCAHESEAAEYIKSVATKTLRGPVQEDMLKNWKKGWALWEKFEEWEGWRSVRRTQAVALFSCDEMMNRKKSPNPKANHGCLDLKDFIYRLENVGEVTRGPNVVRTG